MSRDPIGEDGGLHLYGYADNGPVLAIDFLGLRCRMVWLFGHGGKKQNGQEYEWGFLEAAKWANKLDKCDALIPFMCYANRLGEYLVEEDKKKPKKKRKDVNEYPTIIIPPKDKIPDLIGAKDINASWEAYSIPAIEDKDSILKKTLCEKCCCQDVILHFICEDDPQILVAAKVLSHGGELTHPKTKKKHKVKPIRIFAEKLPADQTFCGTYWQYNCDPSAGYWELVDKEWLPWEGVTPFYPEATAGEKK